MTMLLKFRELDFRGACEAAFALLGQFQQHATAILRIGIADDETDELKAIRQFGGAMRLNEHPFGQSANAQALIAAFDADRNQRLIALGRQSRLASGGLAHGDEFPQRRPEVRQNAEV